MNKACPKYEFSLPRIDMLVYTICWALDAFLYEWFPWLQIKMDLLEAKKIAFQTPVGNFHYIVMLLGLENAGATYQGPSLQFFIISCMIV